MIIIFTPHERPATGTSPRAQASSTHRPRFAPNRPLPEHQVEEEAVFTDPFGPSGASAR